MGNRAVVEKCMGNNEEDEFDSTVGIAYGVAKNAMRWGAVLGLIN